MGAKIAGWSVVRGSLRALLVNGRGGTLTIPAPNASSARYSQLARTCNSAPGFPRPDRGLIPGPLGRSPVRSSTRWLSVIPAKQGNESTDSPVAPRANRIAGLGPGVNPRPSARSCGSSDDFFSSPGSLHPKTHKNQNKSETQI